MRCCSMSLGSNSTRRRTWRTFGSQRGSVANCRRSAPLRVALDSDEGRTWDDPTVRPRAGVDASDRIKRATPRHRTPDTGRRAAEAHSTSTAARLHSTARTTGSQRAVTAPVEHHGSGGPNASMPADSSRRLPAGHELAIEGRTMYAEHTGELATVHASGDRLGNGLIECAVEQVPRCRKATHLVEQIGAGPFHSQMTTSPGAGTTRPV